MAHHKDVTPVTDHVFVFRREGSKYWYSQFCFPHVRNPRAQSTLCDNLEEAKAVARERAREAHKLVVLELPLVAPTFREAAEPFTAWLRNRKDKAATSNERYARDFETYFLECFGQRKVNTLTAADATAYAAWRRENFRKKPPKNQTINREINTLRHLMTYCVEQGWLQENQRPILPSLPTSSDRNGDERDDVEEPESGWFSPAEYIALRRLSWRDVSDPRNNHFERTQKLYRHYLMLLQFHLGARTEEIFNLKHNDYWDKSFDDGDFRIQTVRIKLRGSGKKRKILAPPVVRSLLHKLRVLMHQPLTGKVAPVDSVNAFYRLLKKTGLYLDEENNRRHRGSLRHTRATFDLYYRQVPPPILAVWMGHTVEEQQRTYSKVYKLLQDETLHSRAQRVGKRHRLRQWLREAKEIMARLDA